LNNASLGSARSPRHLARGLCHTAQGLRVLRGSTPTRDGPDRIQVQCLQLLAPCSVDTKTQLPLLLQLLALPRLDHHSSFSKSRTVKMTSIRTQGSRFVAQHLLPHLGHGSTVLQYLANHCTFSSTDTPAPYLVHAYMHAAMTRLCRYLTLAATFTSVMSAQRIDTHIHALPPVYIKALEAGGGDPSGYPTPDWTLDAAISSMDALQTSVGEWASTKRAQTRMCD